MNRDELKNIIEAAVKAAYDTAMKGIDEKIEAAVKLGADIGATVGAEAGAKEAIKAAQAEKKRIRETEYNRKLHNTKLLLRNYRALNEFYQKCVYDLEEAADEYDEDWETIYELMNCRISDEKFYVESIMKSAQRTKVIMAHVNRMLDIYRVMCEESNRPEDLRRWKSLKAMYIDPEAKTAAQIQQEVSKEANVHERTVYKDIDAAAETLTTLFFGIAGLKEIQ